MTIVLGERAYRPDSDNRPNDPGRIRTDASWEERLQRHYALSGARNPATWHPTPPLPRARARPARVTEPETIRPGLMLMYAARMAHARVDLAIIRRSSHDERLLVGEYEVDGLQRRHLALTRTQWVGRSTRMHYQMLYPGFPAAVERWLPDGRGMVTGIRQRVYRGAAGFISLPQILVDGVRAVWGVGTSAHGFTRTGASRRALVAVLAAFLVIAGFARSGRAEQVSGTVVSHCVVAMDMMDTVPRVSTGGQADEFPSNEKHHRPGLAIELGTE